MRKKISRILSIVLTIITLSMIGAVGLAALQMGQNRGVPTLFNHSFFVVSTGSMEPTLPVGVGLIIERVEDFESLRPIEVDPITEEVLYEGDILTFFLNDRIVTHRLVRIEVNPNQPEVYGVNRFVTQGDCFGCSEDNPIYEADIIGRVVHVSPLIGLIYQVASNRIVILLIVVIPLAILTFTEGRTLLKAWKEKDTEEETANATSPTSTADSTRSPASLQEEATDSKKEE